MISFHLPRLTEDRHTGGWARALVILAFLCAVAAAEQASASQAPGIDWHRVARLQPDLKVLVLIESDRPIELEDLALLADQGLVPGDRDPGLVLGLRHAVFSTKVGKWFSKGRLPDHLKGKLLDRFVMSGIYRTSFRVEKEDYWGPLKLSITAPRSGFGRRLLSSQVVVRPRVESVIRVDEAGNRWVDAEFPEVHPGQTIKFHFAFKYLVDVAALLKHDLMLVEPTDLQAIPDDVQVFLSPGYKINPRLPPALAWAREGGPAPPDARREYQRISMFLKSRVQYDMPKRKRYFGGRAVYYDLDDMYQPITTTLARRKGACPDTSLIECAFLRARGIPCRTAGRFGHFFTLLYVPGRGWMSSSVTPTGIPLILAPGPDNIAYQKWSPRIPLRTILWEARVRFEPVED